MDAAVSEALATCLSTVLKDEPWQDFGFRSRPRHGAWFQRFRAQWRVKLENAVLQQMVTVLTAAYVVAGKLPKDASESAAGLYTSNPGITTAFGFASQAEGALELKRAIDEYVSSPPDQWSKMLYTKIRPDTVPDKELAARLFLGCAKFASTAARMVGFLKWQTT